MSFLNNKAINLDQKTLITENFIQNYISKDSNAKIDSKSNKKERLVFEIIRKFQSKTLRLNSIFADIDSNFSIEKVPEFFLGSEIEVIKALKLGDILKADDMVKTEYRTEICHESILYAEYNTLCERPKEKQKEVKELFDEIYSNTMKVFFIANQYLKIAQTFFKIYVLKETNKIIIDENQIYINEQNLRKHYQDLQTYASNISNYIIQGISIKNTQDVEHINQINTELSKPVVISSVPDMNQYIDTTYDTKEKIKEYYGIREVLKESGEELVRLNKMKNDFVEHQNKLEESDLKKKMIDEPKQDKLLLQKIKNGRQIQAIKNYLNYSVRGDLIINIFNLKINEIILLLPEIGNLDENMQESKLINLLYA